MNLLIPFLQTLAVAVGSFATFALLMSYLRYRKMQLIALDQAGQEVSIPSAVMVLLTKLREGKRLGPACLLDIRPAVEKSAADFSTFLKQNLRKQDQVLQLENGEVLALLFCPEENTAAAARRLLRLFKESGYSAGHLRITIPEQDPETLAAWLVDNESGPAPDSEWIISPAEWNSEVHALDELETEMKSLSFEDEEPLSDENSMVDPLTGVLRAVHVPQALRRMLAVIRRSGRTASLLRVEVDELSTYISTYGEKAGNQIFRLTAKVLMENCRETDLIGRYDDNAFVLGVVGSKDDLLNAAVRMSDQIKNQILTLGENDIRFSASFGLASMPGDGKNPVVLLQRATQALSEAKQRGRGMCIAYQPSIVTASQSVSKGQNQPESF